MKAFWVVAAGLAFTGAAQAETMFVNEINRLEYRSDKAELNMYGQKFTGINSDIISSFSYTCEKNETTLRLYFTKPQKQFKDNTSAIVMIVGDGTSSGSVSFPAAAILHEKDTSVFSWTPHRSANEALYKALAQQIDSDSAINITFSKMFGGDSDASRVLTSYVFKIEDRDLAARIASGLDTVHMKCAYDMKK